MAHKHNKAKKSIFSKYPELSERFVKKYKKGGKVKKYNMGGRVIKEYKKGGKNEDNLLALVNEGEVILNKKQQKGLEGMTGMKKDALFKALNVPGFNKGGKVKVPKYKKGGKVKPIRTATKRYKGKNRSSYWNL